MLETKFFVPTPRVKKNHALSYLAVSTRCCFFLVNRMVSFLEKKVTLSAFDRECTLSQVRENQEGIQN